VSAFHDVLFPLRLARGAVGGPERRTEIVPLANGREARNTAFSRSFRRWDVGSAMRGLDDLADLVAFFEARHGRLHAFRFRDPADHKSCKPDAAIGANDQLLGSGDGARTRFALLKRYGDAAGETLRPIAKPVAGSVLASVSGVELAPAAFGVDAETGELVLATPPATGAAVRAGFMFDVPVRFESDRLDVSLDAFSAGRVVSVGLLEVLP
jgi:uncharacterized protein (TIGR02217 family)